MVSDQPLPQVVPMPKPIALPVTVPKVPDQTIPFQGLVNPRPLDKKLLGTLPGYDNDICDVKQPIRHMTYVM